MRRRVYSGMFREPSHRWRVGEQEEPFCWHAWVCRADRVLMAVLYGVRTVVHGRVWRSMVRVQRVAVVDCARQVGLDSWQISY